LNSFNIGELKIPIPIIQGGMGIGISLAGLASAVANMGGIGVISSVGIGFLDEKSTSYRKNSIEAIRKTIQQARANTTGILGVNIMSVLTNFSDMVKTSIEEGIDIIFSGAGLPLDLPKYLNKEIKTKLVPIVSSGRAAAILCNKWKQNFNYLPDALVVEGPKAGGHLGFKADKIEDKSNSLENILADVVEVTNEIKEKHHQEIPVIAAGGLHTGEDIYRIIKQGAQAVQLGTRFVATEECDASEAFKQEFIKATDKDVKIIKSPVGMPGRSIYNHFLQDAEEGKRKPTSCKYNCIRSCNFKTTSYCIAEALIAAYKGNFSDGFAFTGINAGKIEAITTVKQLFTDLESEYNKAKSEDN